MLLKRFQLEGRLGPGRWLFMCAAANFRQSRFVLYDSSSSKFPKKTCGFFKSITWSWCYLGISVALDEKVVFSLEMYNWLIYHIHVSQLGLYISEKDCFFHPAPNNKQIAVNNLLLKQKCHMFFPNFFEIFWNWTHKAASLTDNNRQNSWMKPHRLKVDLGPT